jgi:cobalt/nickel transport system permease protein
MGLLPLPTLWAVHISDGVLATPWLVIGFVGMVDLLVPACIRVRDQEIPRISLLTSAFFVASLIHIRIGPTSAHLLLNGLVGVVLGWRAGLAIPIGLFLQAALLGHGGITSLGVNACVMTLPALAAGGLFRAFHRIVGSQRAGLQSVLVFGSAMAWLLCLAFSVSLLLTNRATGLRQLDPGPAVRFTFQAATLIVAAAIAVVAVWLERREAAGPEFSVGLALGVFSVLATATLNACVLLWGGAEDWHSLVLLVFVAHLPIAVLEGIVLGFTVSFLARVKPEMLGMNPAVDAASDPIVPAVPAASNGFTNGSPSARNATQLSVLLLAALAGLVVPGTAHAHRLEADYRVLNDGRVEVESWFDLTGDSPRGATVQVFRRGGDVVAEGNLDDKGLFTFKATRSEPLRVVVSAGAGHRKELLIPKEDGARAEMPASTPITESQGARTQGTFADRSARVSVKDVVTGVGFLLAAAAFVLSLRNARTLRDMRRDT